MTPDQKIPSCIKKKKNPAGFWLDPAEKQRNRCRLRTHQHAQRDDVTPDAHGPTAPLQEIVLFSSCTRTLQMPLGDSRTAFKRGNLQK